jgi:DNA gyrase subunit A
VDDVRVFAGRASDGVRGIRLADGDVVISMAILRADAVTSPERDAYLKHAAAMRRATGEGMDDEAAEPAAPEEAPEEPSEGEVALGIERIAELQAAEQLILTVSSEGFGKRTSAYDYRRTGRGGQGLIAHDLTRRGGRLVASFPVEDTDELLLVSDQGQLIRVPAGQVRIAGRNTQGVWVFRPADDEHVVSVERIEGGAGGDDEAEETGAPEET